MPFLKIDFSTYNSDDRLQKNLRAQFSRLFRPVQLALTLLCCRINCPKRKNRRRRWIGRCHTVCIILFLFIILSITFLQFWYSFQENSMTGIAPEIVASMWQLQGVLNMLFLVYWDRYAVGEKLQQRLLATSTGIGVLRRKSLLDHIHLGAIISGSIISISVITYRVLMIISNGNSSKIIMKLNLPHFSQWLFAAIFVYVAFSYPAVYAEVYSLISIICAEYRALNDDFADDCNTYQLPVIRHYVTAHWKMSQSHALFNKSLSFWMSFHLLTSSISFIILCRSLFTSTIQLSKSEPFTLAILACTVFLVVITLTQIIASVAMCLSLRHNITHFRYLLIALVASTTALHEQTYSVAIAYMNYLYRSSTGITFFEVTSIDRRFIEQVVIILLLIAATYYINDLNKCIGDRCTTTA